MNRINQNLVGKFHRYLSIGSDWIIYVVLFTIGCIPIVISHFIGVGADRNAPAELIYACQTLSEPRTFYQEGKLRGFLNSYNWTLYPIMLLTALLLVRFTLRETFGESPTSPLAETRSQFQSIRKNTRLHLNDCRTLKTVLLINVLIHIIDNKDYFSRLEYGSPNCTGDLDWGLYPYYFKDVTVSEYLILSSIDLG